MHALLAAAVGVAAAVHGAAAPQPQTLYVQAGATISAFAQDGPNIAWFAPSTTQCNTVHVLSLANGLHPVLPLQSARNVTCRWEVGSSPVGLALAGSRVVWTLREASPIPFDYLLGAGVVDRKERRYQEIAHTLSGSGLWLGGVAGDGSTLVYSVTSIDYEDEAGCLAGTSPCTMKIVGGGVFRMAGRPKLIPGTDRTGAVAVAVSGATVAYVPSAEVGKQGLPLAGTDQPIDVVSAVSGAPIATVHPRGTPIAISLSPKIVATLERTPLGLRIAWYASASGQPVGSVPVSSKTDPTLTSSDRTIVYRVDRSIRAVDIPTSKARTLAHAAANPIGLSLEGHRLAWAENLKGVARIRALTLTP